MSVEIEVRYDGGLHCAATHGPSKATLVTDAPTDNGGKGEAFSPTDLVGTALGTCIMTIMGMVAERNDIDLTGTKIRVVKEMTKTPLRRIGELKITVTYPAGLKLSEENAAKLKKTVDSCPVRQSLHPDIKVSAEFIQN